MPILGLSIAIKTGLGGSSHRHGYPVYHLARGERERERKREREREREGERQIEREGGGKRER